MTLENINYTSAISNKTQKGFSLIELLIVMAIFTIALAISSSMFVNVLGQAKQQSKLAETQLESIAGLEMLRHDLESAGYGLPWSFPSSPQLFNYNEAAVPGIAQANNFNVAPGVPKALDGNTVGPNVVGSSYLVIRATAIATNSQSQTWTGVLNNGQITGLAGLGSDQPPAGAGVIVLSAGDYPPVAPYRQLIVPAALGGVFSVQYTNPFQAAFSPQQPSQLYMIYGVDNNAPLRMPFNRADYFISGGAPASCAPGTGTLSKNILNHANGLLNSIPLIDCVADFQVFFGIDNNNDGIVDGYSQSMADPFTAVQLKADDIRNEVKEIRVYILLHEGRRDPSFNFSDFTGGGTNMLVGEPGIGGRLFNLSGIANYQNYRWKVITMVVTPKNLK